MTAVRHLTPAQRSREDTRPARSHREAGRSDEVLALLRAAETVGADAGRACEGSPACERPGGLTVVTEQGSTTLCGLHAMNVVFSTTSGPVTLVKPGS